MWTGAGAVGTTGYTAYSRDHEVRITGKPALPGSSDPAFRGDPARFTPEELLVAALAQCHMLWFLHLAAADGVVVPAYTDPARATMMVEAAGHGQFTEVVLHPSVTIAQGARTPGGDLVGDAHLEALHVRAHETCFIARSVNFPVRASQPHTPPTRRQLSQRPAAEPSRARASPPPGPLPGAPGRGTRRTQAPTATRSGSRTSARNRPV